MFFSFTFSFLFTNCFPAVTQVWPDSCLFFFLSCWLSGTHIFRWHILKTSQDTLAMFSDIRHVRENVLRCGANLQCFILKFCYPYLDKLFWKDLNWAKVRLVEELANHLTALMVSISHLNSKWPFDNMWKIAPPQHTHQKKKACQKRKPVSLSIIHSFPLLLIQYKRTFLST